MTAEPESTARAPGAADAETGATQCALFSRRTRITDITQSASAAVAIKAIVRGVDFSITDTFDYEAAGRPAQASAVFAFRGAGILPAFSESSKRPKTAGTMPPPETAASVPIDSNWEEQQIRRQPH